MIHLISHISAGLEGSSLVASTPLRDADGCPSALTADMAKPRLYTAANNQPRAKGPGGRGVVNKAYVWRNGERQTEDTRQLVWRRVGNNSASIRRTLQVVRGDGPLSANCEGATSGRFAWTPIQPTAAFISDPR